ASAADLDACAEAAAGAAVALGARRRAFRLYAGGAAGFGSAPAAAGDWRRRLAALAMATNASAEGAAMPPAGLNAAGAHLSRAGAVVVVADALRPETAALCRTCAAGGRDVLLLLAKRTAIGERSSATAAPGAPSPASASPASASPASASRASESRASAGGAPGEPAPDALLSWLLRRGVRVASLDDDGERLLVEGGGADGSTRAVPS
ncbi:MAG TPA: hypothetical protein VEZ72_11605, partial [Paenibacillus sp.]|nr:hypothetical protein [Paenibacillus sp.]